jgi:ATP-dependent Clp protease ATP-binding subunit ClpB
LKRLLARKITLELDAAARTWLADKGYDPVYGARPLKRVIQRYLQDPLAQMLLAGEVLDGATVPVTTSADGLVIGDHTVQDDEPRMKLVH